MTKGNSKDPYQRLKVADPAVTVPPLPPTGASEETVNQWILTAMAALDDTVRKAQWLFHAQGGPKSAAFTEVDRGTRFDLRIAVTEARAIAQVARARDMGARTYARNAIGTMLVVCDGLDPDDVLSLIPDGLLRPR